MPCEAEARAADVGALAPDLSKPYAMWSVPRYARLASAPLPGHVSCGFPLPPRIADTVNEIPRHNGSNTGWAGAERPAGRLLPRKSRRVERVAEQVRSRAARSPSRTHSRLRARAPASASRTGCAPTRPRRETATAVQQLLAAGADMVGKTHCDELCYSLTGENVHFGTPVNVNAPGRVPGGSSNGSAAAVAGGLVDFALGTDCGGSVRIPGELLRHHRPAPDPRPRLRRRRIAVRPEFRCGRLVRARHRAVRKSRRRAARRGQAAPPARLIIAEDAWEQVERPVSRRAAPAADKVEAMLGNGAQMRVSPEGLSRLVRSVPHAAGGRNLGDARRVGDGGEAEVRPRHQGALRIRVDDHARQVAAAILSSSTPGSRCSARTIPCGDCASRFRLRPAPPQAEPIALRTDPQEQVDEPARRQLQAGATEPASGEHARGDDADPPGDVLDHLPLLPRLAGGASPPPRSCR